MTEIFVHTENELSDEAKESIRLVQLEIEKIVSEDIKYFTYQAILVSEI